MCSYCQYLADEAVAMLQSCRGNLEMAINMHLEGLSAAEAAQFNTPAPSVMEKRSFISLLAKVRQALQSANVIASSRCVLLRPRFACVHFIITLVEDSSYVHDSKATIDPVVVITGVIL